MIILKQLFFVGDRVRPKNPQNIISSRLEKKLTKNDLGIIKIIEIDQRNECCGHVTIHWDSGQISENSCALVFYEDYLELVRTTEQKPRLSLIED